VVVVVPQVWQTDSVLAGLMTKQAPTSRMCVCVCAH
jgi:hypothetical protein